MSELDPAKRTGDGPIRPALKSRVQERFDRPHIEAAVRLVMSNKSDIISQSDEREQLAAAKPD